MHTYHLAGSDAMSQQAGQRFEIIPIAKRDKLYVTMYLLPCRGESLNRSIPYTLGATEVCIS